MVNNDIKENISFPHSTPKGSRFIIAIVGRMNTGKSSLLNALTGQQVAITDTQAGTTTDTVIKNYELLPFGPVTFYDTAGLDDDKDELSQKRVEATLNAILRADMALFVTNSHKLTEQDKSILDKLSKFKVPYIKVINSYKDSFEHNKQDRSGSLTVNALNGQSIEQLKDAILELIPESFKQGFILPECMVQEGDLVALITPIDEAAPAKRLILPQEQVLREILDKKAMAIVSTTADKKLMNKKPNLVITDSQVLNEVAKIVPESIPLTTFSVIFANAKSELPPLIEGIKAIKNLKENDNILIAEACSHRTTCNDIGRVKIPNLLKATTGLNLNFSFASGNDFPKDLSKFALIIHCGACMLNKRQMHRRITEAMEQNIPITNYGMTIAMASNEFERIIKPFIKSKNR